MLTTADWLLGSNSQSAAGLWQNEERVFAVLFFCFHTFRMKARSTDDLSHENLYPIYMSSVMWTTVPFIQKGCRNCCGILFQAWFDSDWIWVPSLRMVGLCFYLFFLIYIWMLHAASWIRFFFFFLSGECALSCMHLATIFLSVWRIPPLVHMCLCPEPASLGHVQHDSELLLQPWGIPLSMTSVPTWSIYFTKKRGKENPLACLKENGLISKIRELSESWEMICTDLLLNYICKVKMCSPLYWPDWTDLKYLWHFNRLFFKLPLWMSLI